MKKQMKVLMMLSVLVVLTFGILGCFLFTHLPLFLGRPVKIDPDTGFFEETLEYTYAYGSYYYKYTFSTSGSLRAESYWWDSTDEAWVLDGGMDGTYSWNSNTLILETTIEREYDYGTGIWDIPVYCPYSRSYPAYFTDQNWYGQDEVLVQDETHDRDYVSTYSYSDAEEDTYNYTVTVSILNDSPGASYEVFIEEQWADATGVTDQGETKYVGEVLAYYPEGGSWRKGDIGTYYVEVSISSRDWDPVTDWGDWSVGYENRQTHTFLNMGDFIIEDPTTTAARKLR